MKFRSVRRWILCTPAEIAVPCAAAKAQKGNKNGGFAMGPGELGRSLFVRIACLVIGISCAIVVSAQSTTLLVGTVTDTAGKVVPGATITLTNTSNGQIHKATTG